MGAPNIDISSIDGYSVPITCSSEGNVVSGCNIDLFKQVDGPVCLKPAYDIANRPVPPFFAAYAGAAYTYLTDNDASASNLKSDLITCCVGTSCRVHS